MNIYFAGSIRGGREDKDLYFSIIRALQAYGTVLTEHVGAKDISHMGEADLTDVDIFKRDMTWIKEADIIVAEVSTPSLGVGYELGFAESIGTKIICLYREQEGKQLSAMVAGNKNFKIVTYKNLEDLTPIFEKEFNKD